MIGLLLVCQPVCSASVNNLSEGKSFLSGKQYSRAVESFKRCLHSGAETADGHYHLGEAYLGLKDYKNARKHLRLALRKGRGSETARRANTALGLLPEEYRSPKTGPATRLLASLFGFSRDRSAGQVPRPTLIKFYASWCEPCKQLDKLLAGVEQNYGDKLVVM